MSAHDTIGDFITAIRNASRAGKEEIETGYSRMRAEIARILVEEGYLAGFDVAGTDKIKRLKLRLKYVRQVPALTDVQRYSRPGCRRYCKSDEIPRVLGGLGFAILSTPQGLLKDSDARKNKVGGEVVCTVW